MDHVIQMMTHRCRLMLDGLQVVDMLSAILDVPLRYSLRLFGSHTAIVDPAPPQTHQPLETGVVRKAEASSSKPIDGAVAAAALGSLERAFPLYLTEGKNHGNVKLAAATFWLAKNVELLLEAYDLHSSGTRETLANLYKLITAARSATR